MGTDAAWPLHKAISNCLLSSEKLQGWLGHPLRLYDGAAPDAALPCLVFGDSRSRAWQSATFDGQEHEISLNLWSPPDDAGQSRQIAGEIINLLHDVDLPVPGHALVDMQFESSETRHLAGDGVRQGTGAQVGEGAYHCLLTFKGLTVSD